MKGYIALDMNIGAICRNGIQYELGKWYSIEGEVIPYENGFCFCKSIEELNCYYDIKGSRIFEVEASGEIIMCGNEYIAENIKFVRELTEEEIRDYFKRNQWEFIESKKWYIRCALADQGCCLDKLIGDEDYCVRIGVAKQGYGLEQLIHDEDWRVRKAVAEQGYGLYILINDENFTVRNAVAKQGYELDKLISDESWLVRSTVAEQGYGLDKLIHDKNNYVKIVARSLLKSAK